MYLFAQIESGWSICTKTAGSSLSSSHFVNNLNRVRIRLWYIYQVPRKARKSAMSDAITNNPVMHARDDPVPKGFKKERSRVLIDSDISDSKASQCSIFDATQRSNGR